MQTMVVTMKATVTLFARTLLALGVLASGAPLAADNDKDKEPLDCYAVGGQARYGALGYKHVVTVRNRCSVTLKCQVWTDVDPKPRLSLTVGPGETGEQICRVGSPARSFKAFGECKKAKR